MAQKKALVAGALGIVGSNVANHLHDLGDWEVVGIARSQPKTAVRYRLVNVDLADEAACRAMLAAEAGITHLFYAARAPNPDAAAEAQVNLRMLANLLGPLDESFPGFRHVCLVHGTKWYGCHFGPYTTPAKEDHPRHLPPNFYFDQMDYTAALQEKKAWSWSTVRPHIVCGYSLGYPHNIVAVLAVYATICKELGLPLRFPGTQASFDAVCQATDVRLLAEAMSWTATEPACANESFNIVNGDVFRWRNLWKKLADYFEMEDGGVQTVSLPAMMADKDAAWKSIVAKHQLLPLDLRDIANWNYGDKTVRQEWDHISSPIKARKFGFSPCIDTEDMFLEHLDRFRAERVIP